MFEKLRFPQVTIDMTEEDGKNYFFDPLRKKKLVMTPEEWVRQHVVHYFISLSYPKGLISMESGLKYNRLMKRTDIVVRDRDGGVFMLVECKAAYVKVNKKTIEQASIYNQELKAKYLAVTNGNVWYCFLMDYDKQAYQQMKEFPVFE